MEHLPTHIFQGTSIDAVNQDDSDLIEVGDDFGFSEERFDFGDGRTFTVQLKVQMYE